MGNCLDGGETANAGKALILPSAKSSSGWGGFSQGTNSGLVIGSTTGSSTTSSYNQNSNHFNQSICSSSNLHGFTFDELKDVTKNFCKEGFLGEGGFGSVYKGWMDDQNYAPSRPGMGIVVAVKKLKPESLQGDKEWLAEVHFLGQLHHPNLVKLMGFCAEEEKRLLVYEYMPRGSLENHLFRRGSIFSWANRMKAALGAAKGLAFLHEAGVIYRDFKTSNILLDHEYNSKLSDFGLAKEGPTGDKTHVTTCVIGTYGYAAPEYVATGHLTMKSDVYSFGVVLLELVSGRRAFEANYPAAERELVEWAWLFLADKKKVNRLLDTRLEGKCCSEAFQKVAHLAHSCLHTDPKTRPSMRRVVATLEPLLEQPPST